MKTYNVNAPTPQGPAKRDQQAFLIGVDFHEAALRATHEVNDPKGGTISPTCPMVVCYAFAAELYLKSLLTKTVRNHRLNVLYEHLSDEKRHDVAAAYEVRTGRNLSVLRNDLRTLGVAFVDWRYVFEGEGQQLHCNLLVAFTKSVYETIRRHKPDWKVREVLNERFRAEEETPVMTIKNLGGGTFIKIVDGTGQAKFDRAGPQAQATEPNTR
ncbi:hypothetical protein [Parvibaculum sp.]|uniref:hypothetical protein n=1 Tax=Parvibaculum sp. TaxID=2024848 RepID=UPI001D3FA704|nr:hypothetical protein [Parvibaculum sp.]MBX3488950.1 hypothetical protein [Parvibaculum sp.]